MNTRYIAPIDPPSRRRHPPLASLPRNPLAGLPDYVRRKRSKYTPDGQPRRKHPPLGTP